MRAVVAVTGNISFLAAAIAEFLMETSVATNISEDS